MPLCWDIGRPSNWRASLCGPIGIRNRASSARLRWLRPFQLAELRRLLQIVPLPELADGVADGLRAEAVAAVSSALDEVVGRASAE